MKKFLFLLLILCFFGPLHAQELYNLTEPASTLPKNVLGIRLFSESYVESGLIRKIAILRAMYGVTPKLTVVLSGVGADYHSLYLPDDFVLHDHTGKPPGANTPAVVPYPFIFAGADLYAKYRFYSADGQNSHFRVAAYGEASSIRVASHLAEAELLTHNSGVGAGLIATYLKSHLAVTGTVGGVFPFVYQGNSYDRYGGVYPTKFVYSNAVNFDLALGYLLFPRHYTGYKQTNINLYLELLGKSYGSADVTQRDGVTTQRIPSTVPFLEAGNYVDISPGIQCIIRSDIRVDFSMGFPLVNLSYNHVYPLYYLGFQRYFYFRKKTSEKKAGD